MYKNILLGFEFEVETNNQDSTYKFIDEVSHITGYTEHHVYSYHSSTYRTINGEWRVENDNSIFGAEFISPPIPYIEAREMVKNFFRVIAHSPNAMITNNCGLHVGMSINGTVKDLDLSNFLVSLNQRYIAALWPERIKNKYAKNIGEQIKLFNYNRSLINIENFAKHLFYSHYTFITLKEFNYKKYLELRIPGGKNYHRKFKELFALIDHVASKMLSSHPLHNPNLSTILNKKCTKKIISYVNRTLKHDLNNDSLNFKNASKKLDSETPLTEHVFLGILTLAVTHIDIIGKSIESLYKKLNENFFLYNLIKHCIIHKERYTGNNIYSYIKPFLAAIKVAATYVDVPEKESTYNKVRVLRQWHRLPTCLLTNLLSSIDSKHAHKYLIKHIPSGVLEAIVSDSRGVLKKNAIIHAFKHNRVK